MEFEILLKIREKSGNLKKSYLCKVKIFKFYSCSDVAIYFTSFDFDYHESKLAPVHHILDKFSFN